MLFADVLVEGALFYLDIEVQCVSFSSNVWVGGGGCVGVCVGGVCVGGGGLWGGVRGELPAGGIHASRHFF